MCSCDPYTVYQTYEKSVKEEFSSTISGNQISTYDKYSEPEKGLHVRWDPENSGNTHRKSEERKLKD